MSKKKTKKSGTRLLFGWILLILGLFYIFVDHSIHQIVSLDWVLLDVGFPHSIHILIGIAYLIIAVVLFNGVYKWLKLKK